MRKLLIVFVTAGITLYSCNSNSVSSNQEKQDTAKVKKEENPGYYYRSIYKMYEKDIKYPGEGLCYAGVSVERSKNDSVRVSAYMNFVSDYSNDYSISTAHIKEDEVNYILDYLDACTSFKGGNRKDGFDEICYNLISKDCGRFKYNNNIGLVYIDEKNNRCKWGIDVTTARNIIAGMKEKMIQIRKAESKSRKDSLDVKRQNSK